jgi:PAS domain S-box-containing protein
MDPMPEELDRALALSSDSLLLCDAAGTIVGVNDSLCSLTGYDRQDLLSRKIVDLADAAAGRLIAGLSGEATLDLEADVHCKDGSTKRLQLRLRSVCIGDRPLSMVRVARRRRAADRLPEDPEFVRALLHAAGLFVVCVTSAGKIVLANALFEDLIGMPFTRLRGRPVWELVGDPAERATFRRRITSTENLRMFECLWTSSQDPRRKLAWSATRLAALPPDPPYLLLIGRELQGKDATRRALARRSPTDNPRCHELEERVEQLTRELAQARTDQEALTYAIAHDFRAPLRAMSGLSDALVEGFTDSTADPEGLDYALRIGCSARQMDALVENVLLYSRLAHLSFRLEPQPLHAAVDEVLRSFGQEILDRKAAVSIDVPPVDVLAERSVLFVLLSHLVSNALKFVATGQQPRVFFRSELRDPYIRLSIEDNGIGIPDEYHQTIFKLGERLHPSDVYHGTGMGLAIVGKAVERLRGRVGLHSSAGKGSCFWVDLLCCVPGPIPYRGPK